MSLGRARLLIALASVLWSLGGAFNKILTKPTLFGLNDPPLDNPSLQIAFFRALFAGLVLLPVLRRADITFDRRMLGMVAIFTAMNALYVSAMTLGTAANAIFLQYTAPMWMYVACVWLLGERADRRNTVALIVGLMGIAVILLGGWRESSNAPPRSDGSADPLFVIGLALGSGVAYAGVVIFLRILRDSSSAWLTVLNHLGAALVMAPLMVARTWPTPGQLGFLVIYGGVQMGLPYLLVARGMRAISPQEAGTIMLLEPILNPVGAYLVAGEAPSPYTFAGGAFIVAALAWRYWPFKQEKDE
jgi:drug/metabolite transporter (DMT)-like permease